MSNILILGKREPIPDGYIKLDVTSHNYIWNKYLSPFYLGPATLPDGSISRNMENAWQFSKVYPEMVDDNGEPTKKYFEWRQTGLEDTRAYRHPHSGKPLYAWCNDEKLGYIEARKKLYIPLYCQCIMDNPKGLNYIKQNYNNGHNIALIDFDAYNHKALSMSYEDVINSETKIMGHGFVLAMMIERPDLISAIMQGKF